MDLVYNISRNSPEDQLTDFLIRMDSIVEVAEHEASLNRLPCQRLVSIVRRYPWWKICYMFTVIINVLLVVYTSHGGFTTFLDRNGNASNVPYGALADPEPGQNSYSLYDNVISYFFFTSTSAQVTIYVLGALHFLFSGLMVARYGLSRGFLLWKKLKQRESLTEAQYFPGRNPSEYGYAAQGKEGDTTSGASPDESVDMDRCARCIRSTHLLCLFALQPMVLYYALFIAFDILGLAVSPFFFGPHLFDIVLHNFTLRYVVSAISRRPKQLIATMALAMIIIYQFTITGFLFFQGQYTFGDNDLVYRCDTMLNCLQEHWSHGFRTPPAWNDRAWTFFSTFYDLLFFFLINVIFVSLITGIIIDTFSGMI